MDLGRLFKDYVPWIEGS